MSTTSSKPKGLNFLMLTMVSMGTTIGGGVFSLSGDMAARGADTGAVLVGWVICGIGMLALVLCFFGLNRVKPELNGGIYSYAQAGFGDYIGFNATYGYWFSVLLCNVSYATLLFAAIGNFFPVFGTGNNLISIFCASIFFWLLAYLVSSGLRNAAIVNLVVTISKVIPIFLFIILAIFLNFFDLKIFLENFGGDGTIPFMKQVMATSGTTVWAFIGIEGVITVSDKAEKMSDVGKAVVTAFLSVLGIYILISVLSMGIMTREELGALGNPPLGELLEYMVGPWGAAVINIGVIIALSGAALGCTIISSHIPSGAAKKDGFLKLFKKENKNGAPINSLIITTGVVQIFLIITYFSSGTYQFFYRISASMIMIPYLLSAGYYLKIVLKKEGFENYSSGKYFVQLFAGVVGTIYGLWLLYSAGISGLLIATVLFAPGTLLYLRNRKELGLKNFSNKFDFILMCCVMVGFVVSITMLITGGLN